MSETNSKTEYIGNVKLNLDYYGGKDLYSDGDIENELLPIVTNYPENEYDKIIQEKLNWAVFYHLSHIRENIISGFDFPKNAEVLEIGSGCGAVTGALAKKAARVTCVELSIKRSIINAQRHRNLDNIEIIVGNYEEIEPTLPKFDVITLIGVLEYSRLYIHEENPFEAMLTKAKAHLKPNGRLIIAIENRLGLKYWAGCMEDHVNRFFESLEGYPNKEGIETFSHKELDKLVEAAGFGKRDFYYPYPDYKFPEVIYSDLVQPQKGSLTSNLRNFDNDRLLLFDEARTFDSVVENGLFPDFSNSFLVIAMED